VVKICLPERQRLNYGGARGDARSMGEQPKPGALASEDCKFVDNPSVRY